MATKTSESDNSINLLYFEASTMRNLYEIMKDWQNANKKRLLSCSIQKELDNYCCICLTNPTEVIICDGDGSGCTASVNSLGYLDVNTH